MRTALAAILLVCASTQVLGQEPNSLKLSDLNAQGATQLSKDELQALLPGAKVQSGTGQGSTRNWENSADGSLVASSDNRGGSSSTAGVHASARGTCPRSDYGLTVGTRNGAPRRVTIHLRGPAGCAESLALAARQPVLLAEQPLDVGE